MGGLVAAGQKVMNVGAKLNPLNNAMARIDPGANAMGIYGDKAPAPKYDIMNSTGLFGKDTAAADAQDMQNARAVALQQGETDMGAVERRTSAVLANRGKRKTLPGVMFGD